MPNLTPLVNALLKPHNCSIDQSRRPSPDAFLQEAYRINNHISSLLTYLHSLRHSYLSISRARIGPNTSSATAASTGLPSTLSPSLPLPPATPAQLTDADRDAIDSATASVLRDLSHAITNLTAAEKLRHDTAETLLRQRFGRALLSLSTLSTLASPASWASGTNALGQTPEEAAVAESERVLALVRGNVLWDLRRRLEAVTAVQGGMVEKRLERVKERERSALHKRERSFAVRPGAAERRKEGEWEWSEAAAGSQRLGSRRRTQNASIGDGIGDGSGMESNYGASAITSAAAAAEQEAAANDAALEEQLTPEQIQMFAAENDALTRHYADTLDRVHRAEQSLWDVASLQQTLLSTLATQDEAVGALVADAEMTETNMTRGNRELARARDKGGRLARGMFWATVGLCGGLVLWDLIV